MNCHIVPQVYQKKWHTKNGENNVIYFAKNDVLNGKPGNVSKHMSEKNYYIPTQTESSMLNLMHPTQIEDILNKKFETYYNGLVELFIDFKRHYDCNPMEIHQGIDINDLVDKLGQLELMKEFLIIQNYRRFENAQPYIDKSADYILPKIIESEEIKNKQEILQHYKNHHSVDFQKIVWKSSLANYTKTGELHLVEVISKALTDFTVILLFANEENKFILSDNPVVFNIGENKNPNLPGGVYFAITPNILLCLVKLSVTNPNRENILMTTIGKQSLKYFNYILYHRSFKEIGYMTMSVEEVMDNNPPKFFLNI